MKREHDKTTSSITVGGGGAHQSVTDAAPAETRADGQNDSLLPKNTTDTPQCTVWRPKCCYHSRWADPEQPRGRRAHPLPDFGPPVLFPRCSHLSIPLQGHPALLRVLPASTLPNSPSLGQLEKGGALGLTQGGPELLLSPVPAAADAHVGHAHHHHQLPARSGAVDFRGGISLIFYQPQGGWQQPSAQHESPPKIKPPNRPSCLLPTLLQCPAPSQTPDKQLDEPRPDARSRDPPASLWSTGKTSLLDKNMGVNVPSPSEIPAPRRPRTPQPFEARGWMWDVCT